MDERIAVVGGGLAGALMAAYLGKRGYEVDVLELRPDPRTAEAARGRSINLAISTRGIRALARAGIVDEVLAEAVPMYGRMLHDERGGLRFQRYGRQGQAINSVSRNGLNCKLIEAAERLGNVRFHFASKLERIDLFEGRLSIAGGSEIQAAAVIGADGAFSAVRREMQRQDRFDFSQNYLAHGYKELTIPPAEGGGFRMEPNALHIWPRGGFMMIALPNYDGSYTGTLFWPFD
ncbi:MAG: FAD-dependent oxidoreductase, partial [Gemmatimonadales bacterium]